MRHGVDWDHIAAISDITSTQTSKKKGIFQSFLYAIGHASVVTGIALSALLIGLSFPESLDALMGRVVGFTLLILGLYVFYALYRYGDGLRLLPRWAIVFYGILKIFDWITAKFTGKPVKERKLVLNYGNASAYTIGMIHGIGAETPSQMYMFALALTAGMRSSDVAAIVIIAFALGLVITNTVMGVLGAYGYVSAGKSLYKYLAVFTAVFSIILGLFFIVGAELPDPMGLINGE
jgi:high-affinity nickel-transport protein